MAIAPTVRRRRLGIELNRLRERLGPTVEEVAARLDWSPSKLSRIENARIGVRVSDVRLLLELYKVDEAHLGEVLALAQAAMQPGWWANYRDILPGNFGTYVALEDEALLALTFTAYAVPGLLQCEEYAHRVLESGRVIAISTPREVARRLELRMRRQELLHREKPLTLSAVIDESVLLRMVGDPDVMRQQMRTLLDFAVLPNVQIYILPLKVHREPILSETFTLLKFEPAYRVPFPDIVYIDNVSTMADLQDDEVTHTYRMCWESLKSISLTADESMVHISRMADEWGRR
ncbi:helix-turn-helix domain-containing protein [Actinomadura livida]|uniref:Helix-turn-helix transcriptional regulator n=1 Tax=Actinomadura livida TaxID=79909 RepID=A0A7W7IFQ4_9ACTN|nr:MULTISPECIES: helix-turn-helix transcriptional regulator [Actinomadura]MBB4776145.1 transcriptional regulator with XRE-family HTH domain [Actinomadura catellatispora]GGU15168.1 transcriptional regulator [Actinomadura livida]